MLRFWGIELEGGALYNEGYKGGRQMNSERINIILRELREHKVMRIDDLAQKCFVSAYTVRRDLVELEKQGLIRRTYGRAILTEGIHDMNSFSIRKYQWDDSKRAIGELAADYVRDGDMVFLTASSTASYIIPYLSKRKGLTIITNGLPIAQEVLNELKDAKLITIGGRIDPLMSAATGSAACEFLNSVRADVCFFSCRALSLERGAMWHDEEVLAMVRKAISISDKSICMCDSHKFGLTASYALSPFSAIDTLITNSDPGEQWNETLLKHGVELVYAQ